MNRVHIMIGTAHRLIEVVFLFWEKKISSDQNPPYLVSLYLCQLQFSLFSSLPSPRDQLHRYHSVFPDHPPSQFQQLDSDPIMGVVTYDSEITSSIPPAKMFKAAVLDADNLIPKVLPQAIKSVEVLEGDGGPGTIKLITFGEG